MKPYHLEAATARRLSVRLSVRPVRARISILNNEKSQKVYVWYKISQWQS